VVAAPAQGGVGPTGSSVQPPHNGSKHETSKPEPVESTPPPEESTPPPNDGDDENDENDADSQDSTASGSGSDPSRPGEGKGDENHDHTGPPGHGG
jgi:hypothetical protein